MIRRAFIIALTCGCMTAGIRELCGQNVNVNVGQVLRVVAGMRADFDSAMDKVRALRSENEDARNQLSEMKDRLQAMEEIIAGMNNRLAAMEKRNSEAMARLQELQAQDRENQQRLYKNFCDEVIRMMRQNAQQLAQEREKEKEKELARAKEMEKAAAAAAEKKKAEAQSVKYYEIEVVYGDTLSSIAVATKVPMQELMEINHLESADRLRIGQKLKIPDRGQNP